MKWVDMKLTGDAVPNFKKISRKLASSVSTLLMYKYEVKVNYGVSVIPEA